MGCFITNVFFMRYRMLLFLFIIQCYACNAQNTYSLGVRIGLGFDVPSSRAEYLLNGSSYRLRSNAFYAFGVLGQYLLNNRLGIESGLAVSYQTYGMNIPVTESIKNFLGWNYSEGITDYQIPVRFIYKADHPSNPFKYFIFAAGISADRLLSQYFQKERNSVITSNLLAGIRMVNKQGKLGRTELGIEYQYSLRGGFKYTRSTAAGPEIFKARQSLLSFNLYYFFLNRNT